MMDNGTNSVNIIRYFLGAISEVLAVEAGATQNLAVDENVKLLAKTANGVTASVDLTWGINKELPNFISIYGKPSNRKSKTSPARFAARKNC